MVEFVEQARLLLKEMDESPGTPVEYLSDCISLLMDAGLEPVIFTKEDWKQAEVYAVQIGSNEGDTCYGDLPVNAMRTALRYEVARWK